MFIWISTGSELKKKKKKAGRPPTNYGDGEELVSLHVLVPKSDKAFLQAQMKARIWHTYGHGVSFCIDIVKQVYIMREKQFLEMAKSADMGKTLNAIDALILKGDENGDKKAE